MLADLLPSSTGFPCPWLWYAIDVGYDTWRQRDSGDKETVDGYKVSCLHGRCRTRGAEQAGDLCTHRHDVYPRPTPTNARILNEPSTTPTHDMPPISLRAAADPEIGSTSFLYSQGVIRIHARLRYIDSRNDT